MEPNPKFNILLVDDHPAGLLALEAVLGPLGHHLAKARSGPEALEHLRQTDFAVILLDVQMPGMDGFQTARMIRQMGRDTPVIFVTAIFEDTHYLHQGYQAGAVDYLFKPLDPYIVKSKVMVFVKLYEDKQKIQQQQEELQRAHDELERRVQERTYELAKANEELTRSNADLEQFAYVASHDLKEPLRMVSSFLQLLERRYKGKLDQAAEDFIGYAVGGAKRMHALINDLLKYSRAGRSTGTFGPVNCQTVFEQIKNDLKGVIEENKAALNCDPLPTVVGDATQLTQLFQNLISNAIKFHSERPPKVHVSACPKDGQWLFSVQDNGIGIDGAYRERIFVIFQRLHTSNKYPGTGIGLAICKKIVECHRGRIWVKSQAGQGSVFYFTLPVLRPIQALRKIKVPA